MNIANLENTKLIIDEVLSEKLKESIEEVIPMFLMTSPDLVSERNVMDTPIKGRKVSVGISLMGDLGGSIFLSMNIDTAKKIASTMTMEEFITELNEFHESALREMLNMISGTFVSKISCLINPNTGEVYGVDISSPICIVSDSSISIWVDKVSEVREILFDINGIGNVSVYLGVKTI